MGSGLQKRLQQQAHTQARAVERAQRSYERAVRRREGQLARARRRLPVHSAIALGAGALAGPVLGDGPPETLLGVVAVLSGVIAARALRLLRRPPPAPEPPRVPQLLPPPPPPGSSAWPFLLRLQAVQDELGRLLPLVGQAAREAAEEAWQAAGEADAVLRLHAARLAAVEPHRGPDAGLLHRLEDGVQDQERLRDAFLDLVAAGDVAVPGGPVDGRLAQATDRLQGLAAGLRELR